MLFPRRRLFSAAFAGIEAMFLLLDVDGGNAGSAYDPLHRYRAKPGPIRYHNQAIIDTAAYSAMIKFCG